MEPTGRYVFQVYNSSVTYLNEMVVRNDGWGDPPKIELPIIPKPMIYYYWNEFTNIDNYWEWIECMFMIYVWLVLILMFLFLLYLLEKLIYKIIKMLWRR